MRYPRFTSFAAALAAAAALAGPVIAESDVGTGFTYRGVLKQFGTAYQGTADLSFRLFDAPTEGGQIGPDLFVDDFLVDDGLLIVDLDFGSGVFQGGERWLEIEVNGTSLDPRQPLMAVPYAQYALEGVEGISHDAGYIGIGTTTPVAPLHVVGSGDFRGQHVAFFDSTGNPDADGIAIQVSNTNISGENRFIAFFDGNGANAGRIEGFDKDLDFWSAPPLPTLGVTLNPGISTNPGWLDPGQLPVCTLSTGSLPTASFSAGSLPSMSFNTTSVLGVTVVTGVSFNDGSLPSLSFNGGSLPSLSCTPGQAPSINGPPLLFDTPSIDFDLPTEQELQDLMCWALDSGIGDIPANPIDLAVFLLKLEAERQCKDGGVSYCSTGADYAEWLPKLDAEERFQFGQVVGVFGGKISKKTEGADQVMAVSLAPIVLGNQPPADDVDQFEKVAFMGQIPVVVRGNVAPGDYILPSGLEDGTGRAVTPDELAIDDLPKVLGRAWSASNNSIYSMINVAVGLDHNAWVQATRRVRDQQVALQQEIDELRTTLGQVKDMLASSVDPALAGARAERDADTGEGAVR